MSEQENPPVSSELQPSLFDEKCIPIRPDLVALVKDKEFRHTGAILSRDRALCLLVCEDLMLGVLSGRQIAKKFGISRSSILSIEKVMRERNELGPLKNKVMGLLDDCIYLGLENYRDALAAGTVAPAQIPIPMGILIDKKGQLEAGVVPGTERTVREVTVAEVQRAWERLKAGAIEVSSDVQSVELPPNAPETGVIAAADTGLDTRREGARGGSGFSEGGPGGEGSSGGKISS